MSDHILDYTPKSLHRDTFHPMKCLWVSDKFRNLVDEKVKENDNTDNVIDNAFDELGILLNLEYNAIQQFVTYGMYIRDYLRMTELSPEELDEYELKVDNSVKGVNDDN